jgi:hypothetical protein
MKEEEKESPPNFSIFFLTCQKDPKNILKMRESSSKTKFFVYLYRKEYLKKEKEISFEKLPENISSGNCLHISERGNKELPFNEIRILYKVREFISGGTCLSVLETYFFTKMSHFNPFGAFRSIIEHIIGERANSA